MCAAKSYKRRAAAEESKLSFSRCHIQVIVLLAMSIREPKLRTVLLSKITPGVKLAAFVDIVATNYDTGLDLWTATALARVLLDLSSHTA